MNSAAGRYAVLLLIALLVALPGCSRKYAAGKSADDSGVPGDQILNLPTGPGSLGNVLDGAGVKPELAVCPVFFDYDRDSIRPDQEPALAKIAATIQENAPVMVVLEGHCDERGTVEYNLALGQRRADAVSAHLKRLGVDPEQLRCVSYGKEFPADPGHDESAWAKNRRVVPRPNQ